MSVMMNECERAIPQLEQSLSVARGLGDRPGIARALLILGSARYARGDTAVLPLLEESAAQAREGSDAWCLSHALGMAGREYIHRDDPAASRTLFEECLRVARQAGDKQGLQMGLLGLGSAAVSQGDYGAAEPVLEEVGVLAEELGEEYTGAIALLYLGQNAFGRGDYARSSELLDRALALSREAHPFGLIAPLVSRARVARAQGEPGTARKLLDEALGLARAGLPGGAAALVGMGELLADEGDLRAASRLLEEALDLARRDGDQRNVASALHRLGQLARVEDEVNEVKRAVVLQREALKLRRESGNWPGIAGSIEAVAGLEADQGRPELAARLLGATQAARERNGWTRPPWEQPRHEHDMALLRQSLNPRQIETAFRDGATLSLDEAAAQAGKARCHPAGSAQGWGSLTEKEKEVGTLVAEGLTNPEIAERLVVSPWTIKIHVSNIFGKLGMTRRSELTRLVLNAEQQEGSNPR